MSENWAPCASCPHAPGDHAALVVKPICIDPPARVLFEGTLGACEVPGCECRLWQRAPAEAGPDWAAVKARLAEKRTIPDGCELAALADNGWRLEAGKLCARRVATQRNCRKPSFAELNRRQYRSATPGHRGRYVDSWWPYCLEHFLDYGGHWVEDGKVMTWILQEIEGGSGG